jgi:hypothetical protein
MGTRNAQRWFFFGGTSFKFVSMLRMGRLQGVYKPEGVLEVRASVLLHEGASGSRLEGRTQGSVSRHGRPTAAAAISIHTGSHSHSGCFGSPAAPIASIVHSRRHSRRVPP